MLERLKERLKKSGFFHCNWAYIHQIKNGCRIYQEIIARHGDDVMIFTCALHGTGDIFFVSRYLKNYIEREKIKNYVFLLGGKAEASVTKLFPTLFDRTNYEIIGEVEMYDLMRFRLFCGCRNINIRHFHHCSYTPQLTATIGMEGRNNLSMKELYLFTTFNLPEDSPILQPVFNDNKQKVTGYFLKNKLKPHKTVVLAPYSVSGGHTDLSFWRCVAEALSNAEYTVCTNSTGPNEPVIEGTTPISFAFEDAKSFLEYAGTFIGYRSGLCDIISPVKCTKIIIYPRTASYCPVNKVRNYVGLKEAGLCSDAFELYYDEKAFGLIMKKLRIPNSESTWNKVASQQSFEPAFASDLVAVATAVSEEYLPYFCVTVQSIIEHSAKDRNYDIIVLGDGLTDESKKKTRKQIKNHPNFSIRFMEVSDFLSQYNLPIETQYKPIIYARFMFPDLLQRYEKVVYIDADTILMDDIAKLYDMDLQDNILIGIRDTGMLAWYHTPGNPERTYIDNKLKLKNPDDFFNSGVIVFNIPLFHATFTTEYLFNYSTSRFWKWRDQDVFMTLCDGKIGHADQAWNVLVPYFRDEISMLEEGACFSLKEQYLNALKNPKIVHFIGNGFLSLSPAPPWSEYFWLYAKKTEFYDVLVSRAIELTCRNKGIDMTNKQCESIEPYSCKNEVLSQFKRQEIGFKYILECFWAYIRGKLSRGEQR